MCVELHIEKKKHTHKEEKVLPSISVVYRNKATHLFIHWVNE